jgi:glycine/D-amino acid oxidase-like deaminating enzyme
MDRIDEDLYVISGHYRNGILLSPIIGRDIANWIDCSESKLNVSPLMIHFMI